MIAALAAGCGASTPSHVTPTSPAYRQAVALVEQDASHPDWSTTATAENFRSQARSLSQDARLAYAALELAYAGQLERAHQLPTGATGQLSASFASTVPGLVRFLKGDGARLQSAFLNSDAFKTTFGRQLGCLSVQALAQKYGGQEPASCQGASASNSNPQAKAVCAHILSDLPALQGPAVTQGLSQYSRDIGDLLPYVQGSDQTLVFGAVGTLERVLSSLVNNQPVSQSDENQLVQDSGQLGRLCKRINNDS